MTLDFQKVHEQVLQLGKQAPERLRRLQELRQQARDLLKANAGKLESLRQKVENIAQHHDPNLRCARPADGPQGDLEPLDGNYPLPQLPNKATILAADGSQIAPDRHAPVNYCLINIGSIQMQLGCADAPQVSIQSELMYDEQLYVSGETISEARLALMRDLRERRQLADMAENAGAPRISGEAAPVISFTDGPMELWGGKDAETSQDFQESLEAYLAALRRLEGMKVATAGYVDKPAANLVVRLLEVASLPDDQLPKIRGTFPLRGVLDRDLFWNLLAPGQRSAVFAIQSNSRRNYLGGLALHFFYLNVGRPGHAWLARVEIPAWVVSGAGMLDGLQAVLVQQCQMLGNRPYPYLLHRAHEAALVTWQDKEQVGHMIEMELRRQGVEIGESSHKQALKDLPGKTAYER